MNVLLLLEIRSIEIEIVSKVKEYVFVEIKGYVVF